MIPIFGVARHGSRGLERRVFSAADSEIQLSQLHDYMVMGPIIQIWLQEHQGALSRAETEVKNDISNVRALSHRAYGGTPDGRPSAGTRG